MTNRKERRAAKSQGHSANPAVQKLLEQAMRAHQAGRLAEAEPLYRQILAVEPRHADSLHLLGLLAHQVGRSEIAVEMIGQAIKINSKMPAYYNNLGIVLIAQDKIAEAVAAYRRALTLAPNDAEIFNNLGVALEEQGKFDEALSCFQKALALRPDYASAYYNMGNIFKKQSLPEDAALHYQKAIAAKPDYFEACNNLAVLLKEQGKYTEAAAYCERALQIKPDYAEACLTLGSIFKDLEKPEEAVNYYHRALSIRPDYADAYNNLGLALHDLGRFDEARACYERALGFKPGRAEVYNNLGTTLEEQGNWAEARAAYRQALTLAPASAEAYYNLGNLAHKEGHIEEAVENFERAIAIRPGYSEAHWNQAFLRLLKGDFLKGWRESEWRWQRKNIKPHGFAMPLWDGRDLQGQSILLHCEQGLGDSIQFIRYARLVKEKGGTVLLLCPAALAALFKDVEGVDQIFTEARDLPSVAYQAPLLSLPGILGTTLETIPAAVPYLKADPARLAAWRDRLAGYSGLKIGIVWRGNSQHKNDRNRSIAPDFFAKFLDLPGLSVVSLQKDGREEEIGALNIKGAFLNAGPELQDFADTAALVSNLDLIITVDTSVCHLAGALRLPVWTLLPFAPDWRWLLERADSPWYPTMCLLRQPAPGDWQSVMRTVRESLAGTTIR